MSGIINDLLLIVETRSIAALWMVQMQHGAVGSIEDTERCLPVGRQSSSPNERMTTGNTSKVINRASILFTMSVQVNEFEWE